MHPGEVPVTPMSTPRSPGTKSPMASLRRQIPGRSWMRPSSMSGGLRSTFTCEGWGCLMNTQAIALETCSLEPVWFVWVELCEGDGARVREAVADAVGLNYGAYDRVAFESAFGSCFFRPRAGARSGVQERVSEIPV